MSSRNDARIRRLKKRLSPPKPPGGFSEVDLSYIAVLEAYGDMKGAMAKNSFRGNVPIEPVNRAAEVYGPEYTQKQFRELAIRTGLAERGYSPEEIEDRIPEYLEFYDAHGGRDEHIGAVD